MGKAEEGGQRESEEKRRVGDSEREIQRARERENYLSSFPISRSLLKKLQAHDTEPHEFGQVFIQTVHTNTYSSLISTCVH